MFLSSSDNSFKFLFPKIMFPDNIVEKYRPYLERIPGAMVDDPIDTFNYSIQSLSMPQLQYDPITQIDHPGSTRQYRAHTQPSELYEKTITVTLQTLTGFVNYFMAIDLFNHYYSFDNKQTHLPCTFDVNITDSESNVVSTLHFEDILMTSVSGLEFNFSSNTVDFKTFEITFAYNIFEIIINYK